MRKFLVEGKLRKTMGKLSKKDPSMFDDLPEKIDEIITCKNIDHYKNLRKPLQHLKRVHIKGPFILTFRHIESEDKVIFYDFDHHNRVYK